MENNEVVNAPAAAPSDAEPTLADYRATREPAASTDRAASAVEKKPAAAAAAVAVAPPVEPGDPEIADTDEAGEETPVERKKKLGGYQKTILRQAAELAELKSKLGAGAATPAPGAPAVPAVPAATEPALPAYAVPKPKLEDCESLEDFNEKFYDWKADERAWNARALEGRAKAQAEVKAQADNWNARKTAFVAEHGDWDAAMAAVADVKLSPAHQQIFLESPHGVELAYALANDRAELERIAKLSPLAAAREIGKLEAAYGPSGTGATEPDDDAAGEAQPIKVSRAPAPFKPVNGNNARVAPNIATMTPAEYRKARESGRLT